MKLLLTGERFNAQQAFDMGLASEVVADAELEDHALHLASELAQGPRLALQFIKEAVLESMSSPLPLGLQFERKSFQLLFGTADKRTGIAARLAKQSPRFE
jgi:enoyl-CoA hydratase/carnithine racemase